MDTSRVSRSRRTVLFLVALLAAPHLVSAQDDKDLQRHLKALEKARDFNATQRLRDSISALGERAVPALPALVRLLDHKEFYVRVGAQRVLEALGPIAAPTAPTFMAWLSDSSASRRGDAVTLLAKIAPAESQSARQALALSDPSPRVREQALEAVTDPAVLASIIRSDSARNVRVSALRRLSDQPTLGELARAELPDELVDAVFEKLSDRKVLLELVASGPSAVRFQALTKLPSFVVTDLATTHADPAVRADAAWIATDAAALHKLSRTDKAPAVREAARISAMGKESDLRVGGLDCKPDEKGGRNAYDCYVRLVNNGVVAYTDIRYILGTTFASGINASGTARRLNATLQPGETGEYTLRLTNSSSLDTNVQFRLVSARKAAPAPK